MRASERCASGRQFLQILLFRKGLRINQIYGIVTKSGLITLLSLPSMKGSNIFLIYELQNDIYLRFMYVSEVLFELLNMNFFNKNYTSESKNSIIKSHY